MRSKKKKKMGLFGKCIIQNIIINIDIKYKNEIEKIIKKYRRILMYINPLPKLNFWVKLILFTFLLLLITTFVSAKLLPLWENAKISTIGKDKGMPIWQVILMKSIRMHEDGKEGRQFGILYPIRPKTYEGQARACANTIVNNYRRFNMKVTNHGEACEFIARLGNVYAPIGASNDPNNLNIYWTPSVISNYHTLVLKEMRKGKKVY